MDRDQRLKQLFTRGLQAVVVLNFVESAACRRRKGNQPIQAQRNLGK